MPRPSSKELCTGACYRGRIDPLWHLLLHAESKVEKVIPPGRTAHALVAAAEKLRGEIYWWPDRSHGVWSTPFSRGGSVLEWIQATPLVHDWVRSRRAFVAPPEFPLEVAKCFAPFSLTPFELACAIPPRYREYSRAYFRHDVAVLLGFCHGLDLEDIGAILSIEESAVIRSMVAGARILMGHEPFLLWLANIDLALVPLDRSLDKSFVARLKAYTKMIDDVLSADRLAFCSVPESYWQALRSGKFLALGTPRVCSRIPAVVEQ